MPKTKTIEAVLKITERCNIDCTYCYVFNKGDESYKLHPPYMPSDVIRGVAKFLGSIASDESINLVALDFHGGEPLMMKKNRFIEMCEVFREEIPTSCKIRFSLQTNAMLVDEEWLEIFERFQVSIGVSIDGPKTAHDRHRVDKSNNGTYERVVEGLTLLQTARREGRISNLGVLCVASPTESGSEFYGHLTTILGITNLDFLLPIDPVDAISKKDIEGYGKFLIDAFDAWIAARDRHVHVRIFQKAISSLANGQANFDSAVNWRNGDNELITVASNGDLGPDDSLRSLNIDLFNQYNVLTTTPRNYFSSPATKALQNSEHRLPDSCQECCWKFHCRGGAANGRLINRFRPLTGFNNASGLCDALKRFYSHVAAHLLKEGLSYERLKSSLILDDSSMSKYVAACEFSDEMRPSSRRNMPIYTLKVQ